MKIVCLKVAPASESQRERIPRCQHRRRACSWREIQWASLDNIPNRNMRIAESREIRGRSARNADARNTVRLQMQGEIDHFRRLSAVRKQERDIAFSHSTKVSVNGFGRMNDMRRLPQTCKSCRDFRADQARFSQSSDNHVTGT